MPPNTTSVVKTRPISFAINEQTYSVFAGEVSANLSLASYLRDHLGLKGTKITCGQGGCGACVVSAEIFDHAQSKWITKSINSCVTPILSCDGWFITTVEGLGSKKKGLHPIQARLAAFHGTQCGYCTPGMVMQMNSLLSKTPDPTMSQIESSFDGNLCRCTGYRPIMDAFKTFAIDADPALLDKVPDIEECDKAKICPKTREPCTGKCSSKGIVGKIKTTDGEWYMPTTLEDLLGVLTQLPKGTNYKLVAGNITGFGNSNVLIDVKRVGSLGLCKTSPELEIGGLVAIQDIICVMEDVASHDKNYFYGKNVAAHFKKVANTSVRNMGTIGGNLMIKHGNNAFASDIFVIMEALGAEILTVGGEIHTAEARYHPVEWLKHSMEKKVILKIIWPKLDPDFHHFKSFKIATRSQNAKAIVNAAFLIKVNKSDNFRILERPSLVYGNISGSFNHASKTEDFLLGKRLNKMETLQSAMEILFSEVHPTSDPILASPGYRRHLTQALFYKFVLSVLVDNVKPELRSGSEQIHMPPRNVSYGEQFYLTDDESWPVDMPMAKIEGKSQCTGEAQYVNDIPHQKGELFAAFVNSTIANCDLDVVDPSEALKLSGVVAFVDYKDVPGMNNWSFFDVPEEIFSSGHVYFAGQTIGMIVAETECIAKKGAQLVKITYKNMKEPILSIKQAMENDPTRVTDKLFPFMGHPVGPNTVGDVEEISKDVDLIVVDGEIEVGSQYHFYMENQACIVRPVEDGQFEIFSTCQWMHIVQILVASALNIQRNKVDLKVRRLGGGYGGKAVPSQLVACATAVACNKVNKPVRVVMDLKTNMEMFGKRDPWLGKYKVAVTRDGFLKSVDMDLFAANGWNICQSTMCEAIPFAQNVYNASAWNLKPYAVITDHVPNTFCRSPGTTSAHNIMEFVMDHIAHKLNMDPVELRLKNLLKDGDPLVTGVTFEGGNPTEAMVKTLKKKSCYDKRKLEIEEFNEKNVWRKRGISLVPCKYEIKYFPLPNYCHISVYEGDGTVSVATGGIEMGQGLNTKVAQTVARELKIPLDLITVKPSDTFVEPNNSVTGGSMTSELCVEAARRACGVLRERMSTVASNMQGAKWHELVTACHYSGIDLCARHMGNSARDNIKGYFIWGCIVSEVEVDLLTGEKKVLRCDILADTGASLNPEIDIGQIEGAFMFGLGLWLQEDIIFDPKNGRILNFDTWDYKPPACFDIPEDLRVSLYEWDKDSGRGVLGSKATGEPATHMGVSIVLALRNAIAAGKKDVLSNNTSNEWFTIAGPATVEKTQAATKIDFKHFVI